MSTTPSWDSTTEVPSQRGEPPSPPLAPAGPVATAWYRKHYVHLLAVGLLALGVGAAAGGSNASGAESRATAAEAQVEHAEARLTAAEGDRDSAIAQMQAADGEATKAEADAKSAVAKAQADAKSAVAKAQADAKSAVAKAQADAKAGVAAERARVNEAQAAVLEREKAVGLAEQEVAANTIEGDGTYLVGEDIKPGTYKSAGGEGCYWERSAKDGDILANNLSDGPAVMNVRASDYSVSVNDCASFVLQR